jgi:hypothetical protein
MGELSHISSEFDNVSNMQVSSFSCVTFLQGRFIAYVHFVTTKLSLLQADCSHK